MSKMSVKKFSIYEFNLEINDKLVEVAYKKDEEDSSKSIICFNDGKKEIEISADLFTALHEALNEIDPYGFVFSDLDLGEEEE